MTNDSAILGVEATLIYFNTDMVRWRHAEFCRKGEHPKGMLAKPWAPIDIY